MIIKTLFLTVLIFGATQAQSQNHLDYSYTLDALSYSIPGYENEEFYFKAHLYPVFHSHSNDSILNMLNALFREELVLPKSAKLKERLVAVKIDDLMSDRQVLEMLMARIGLLNENADDLDYLLDVRTDRIDFPDNRNTVFNYRFIRKTSANPVHVTTVTNYSVYDWASGLQKLSGDYGDNKLTKCIQDATKSVDLSAFECGDGSSIKQWQDDFVCTTPIGKYAKDRLTYYIPLDIEECEYLNQPPLAIEVLTECFKNDKPCYDGGAN